MSNKIILSNASQTLGSYLLYPTFGQERITNKTLFRLARKGL